MEVASASPEERGEVSEGYRIRFMTQGQSSETDARRITRSVRKKASASGAPSALAREFNPPGEETYYATRPEEVVVPVVEHHGRGFQPEGDAHPDSEEEEEAPMEMVRRGPSHG